MHFFYKQMEFDVPDTVYYPREDSILLAEFLGMQDINGKIVLDVGTGCGLLAAIAVKNGGMVSAIDIDKRAVKAAKKNFKLNKVDIKCFKSDLFEKVSGKFDLIVFNAPYLPEEIKAGNKSWAAGEGLAVIKSFIEKSRKYLKKNGKNLLLVSSATGLEKIYDILAKNKCKFQIIAEKKIPWENLIVIEFT